MYRSRAKKAANPELSTTMAKLLETQQTIHALANSALDTYERNNNILAAIEREIKRRNNPMGGLNSIEIAAYELEKMHLWPHEPPYHRG